VSEGEGLEGRIAGRDEREGRGRGRHASMPLHTVTVFRLEFECGWALSGIRAAEIRGGCRCFM